MTLGSRLVVLLSIAVAATLIGGSGQATAAPANDNFAARQTITGALPITVAASNISATAEMGEPQIGGNDPRKTIWFSWTSTVNGTMVVDMCDDGFTGYKFSFLAIGVRTGATLGTLMTTATGTGQCLVRFPATVGTVYHFQVDYHDEGNFNFKLRNLNPPANDNFAGAANLGSALPTSFDSSTVDSGWEAGEPAALGGTSQSRSVWFTWTAPASERIRLSVCSITSVDGATNKAVIAYTGATLATLSEAAKVGVNQCSVDFMVTAGTSYKFAVSGTVKGEFLFTLDLKKAPPPTNDNFASGQVVGPGLPIRIQGNNDFASAEPMEPKHGGIGNPAFHSVWYRWTPAQSGTVRVRACNPKLASELRTSIYTGATLATLVEISKVPPYSPHCSVTADVAAGTEYRIAVDAQPGSDTAGPFELDIHTLAIPANDLFADAQNIGTGFPQTVKGTTVDSFQEVGEPAHSSEGYSSPVGSVWYRWKASSDLPVIFEVCSPGEYASRVAVFSGSTLEDLKLLDDSFEGCRNGGVGGRLAIPPVSGTTYRISVTPVSVQIEAPFTLRVIGPTSAAAPFNLKKAIAKCKKKFPGKSAKAKRKRSNCIKAARRKAALIKCARIKDKKKRSKCTKSARRRFK